MKPESLRIRNLVTSIHNDSLIGSVSQILDEGIIVDDFGGLLKWGDIKPIKLSGEKLVEFGFEKFGDYKIYNKVWRKGWTLSVQTHSGIKDGYVLFIEDDDSESAAPPSVEIKYVHQLQNLCFDLTGEELTLKEKV